MNDIPTERIITASLLGSQLLADDVPLSDVVAFVEALVEKLSDEETYSTPPRPPDTLDRPAYSVRKIDSTNLKAEIE